MAANQIVSNEEAIKAFLLDVSSIDRLRPWISKINVFDVLKISRAEIRHSNILAWLFDANETHGMDDRFIRGVIHRVVDNNKDYFSARNMNVLTLLTIDFSNFVVFREWNSIDLLLKSKADKLVICIENKVGTGEHDNQLNRYMQRVESNFTKNDGYDYIYIYLTPDKSDSSDKDNWVSFGYADIIEILHDTMSHERVDERAAFIIKNYIETLRRYVVKDKELEVICQEIYSKHKQALDLIFENRPSSADLVTIVGDILNQYFEERSTNQKDIIFIQNKHNAPKTIKRFKMESFEKVFPPIADAQGFWGDGINYFWEVKSDAASGKMKIIFTMCNYELLNGGKAAKLASLLNTKLYDKWSWKVFESISVDFTNGKVEEFAELDKDEMREIISERIDKAMEKVLQFEQKVMAAWES